MCGGGGQRVTASWHPEKHAALTLATFSCPTRTKEVLCLAGGGWGGGEGVWGGQK